LHVIQELSLLLENAVLFQCTQRTQKNTRLWLTALLQNDDLHGTFQDSGVQEEERRWQNLLAQSPHKGDFEFDAGDVMM
jgi:hypothetical protein